MLNKLLALLADKDCVALNDPELIQWVSKLSLYDLDCEREGKFALFVPHDVFTPNYQTFGIYKLALTDSYYICTLKWVELMGFHPKTLLDYEI